MKYTKRILTVLVMALLVVALALLANAEGTTIVDSGQCGENLAWTLDSEGTLKISGTGEMNGRFGGRKDIKAVIIGNGVLNINGAAFFECTSLKSVVISDSVEAIEGDAFYRCQSLTNVTIGKGVKTIGYSAFALCTSLRKIDIPDHTEWIGNWCFAECINLNSVTLGKNLIGIGREAFISCGFETIEIPAFLKYICAELADLEDFEESDVLDYGYAFAGCYLLSSIKVATNNPFYTSVDGILFSKDQSVLIKYPEAKKGNTYSIPAQVKTINAYALNGNDYLNELVIPKSVETIYPCAFSDCINLKKVYILNPTCAFLSTGDIIGGVVSSNSTTLCGYAGSTAETVSLLNNCRFEPINDSNLPGSGTTSEPTTQPTTESDDQSKEEEEEHLNFFQRIIQWFKNLFAKLFGKK